MDSSEGEDEDKVTKQYLDSLLEKARRSIAAKAAPNAVDNKRHALEEDIIGLDDPESELKYVLYLLLPFFPRPNPQILKKPPSTGPGHSTAILHHAWRNT